MDVTGVTFCEVKIATIGKYEPDEEYPNCVETTPGTEELIKKINTEKSHERYKPLYEMIIKHESVTPACVNIERTCRHCGFEEINNADCGYSLSIESIPNDDIFYLGTTLFAIVSDKVKNIITENRLTNILFSRVDVV